MFYFGYAVRSEKYVSRLRGTRNAVSLLRPLNVKAKIRHFDQLHKNELRTFDNASIYVLLGL